MSKILYIGHLYEGASGWARAAKDYIKSLKTKYDVVARNVFLNNEIMPEQSIVDLLVKDSVGVTHVIQHLLPHWMDYNGRIKNIGIPILESQDLQYNHWSSKLNLLDELWCPDTSTLKEPSLTISKKYLPHAVNVDVYDKLYNKYPLPSTFNFYTIGEFVRRKNFPALIRAFHNEFSINEPVNLIIKTSKFNTKPRECFKMVHESFDKIKAGLKLYPNTDYYKKEIVITEHLSEEELMGIHESCHCFIGSSYGEAWGYGAFDAMAFGNSVISTKVGGTADYLQEYSNGHLIEGKREPCYATLDTFPTLQTSREKWYSIDVLELQKSMRNVYENHKRARREGREIANKYSYESIGNIMEKYIESN